MSANMNSDGPAGAKKKYPEWFRFADIIQKINALRLQEPLLLFPKESAIQVVVTKHLSATGLVTEIKKALLDQKKRASDDDRKLHEARSLVEALHEKARDNTNVALIKQGALLPNPKHLDWENDTDPGDTKPTEHSYLKHGYEKEIEEAENELADITAEIGGIRDYEVVPVSQLCHALITFSLNDRQSELTEYFMDEFQTFASVKQGKDLVWSTERVLQWMSKDVWNRASNLIDSNPIESVEKPINSIEKRGESGTSFSSLDPNSVPRTGVNSKPTCDYCGYLGHEEERCWFLHPELKLERTCHHCKTSTHDTSHCFKLHPELKKKLYCKHCKRFGHMDEYCWELHPNKKSESKAKVLWSK